MEKGKQVSQFENRDTTSLGGCSAPRSCSSALLAVHFPKAFLGIQTPNVNKKWFSRYPPSFRPCTDFAKPAMDQEPRAGAQPSPWQICHRLFSAPSRPQGTPATLRGGSRDDLRGQPSTKLMKEHRAQRLIAQTDTPNTQKSR